MSARVRPVLLRVYGRLPMPLRLGMVRAVTPSYRVGAVCVVERDDGAVLLVRHSYRRGWGFPGGLLQRGEEPIVAARRESAEELGVDLDIEPDPLVVVDPGNRRVDVIYRARLSGGNPALPQPQSAEILEVGWFPPDALPPLGKEAAAAVAELGRVSRG